MPTSPRIHTVTVLLQPATTPPLSQTVTAVLFTARPVPVVLVLARPCSPGRVVLLSSLSQRATTTPLLVRRRLVPRIPILSRVRPRVPDQIQRITTCSLTSQCTTSSRLRNHCERWLTLRFSSLEPPIEPMLEAGERLALSVL